jgi:glycine cleavage system H lipoate-binding protein/ferredoxin
MLNLKINGKDIQIEKGKMVLDACQKSGIDIPTLCHHKDLTGYGSCRLCQVEVTERNKKKIVVSCLYPVKEGLVVETHSPKVERNRKLLLELLLARCPNSSVLQNMAKKYTIAKPRFSVKSEDCILCGLCVRTCSEILGVNAISFAGRGTSKKVEVPFMEFPEQCLGCGACTYVCPTGAIQMETNARKRWALYLSSGDRECRYSRMGLVSHKVCPNAFKCDHCEVDQRMEDVFKTHPAFVAKPALKKQTIKIGQFDIMPNTYYTTNHIWVKPLSAKGGSASGGNGKVRIGMDDFASKFMGNVEELNFVKSFQTDKPAWSMEIHKRKLDIFLPFAGEITKVNPMVRSVPSLVAKDPYRQGWLFIAELKDRGNALAKLITPLKASKVVKQHSEKLQQMVSKGLGTTLMDSRGDLVNDIPGKLSDEEWASFTKEFFAVSSKT